MSNRIIEQSNIFWAVTKFVGHKTAPKMKNICFYFKN